MRVQPKVWGVRCGSWPSSPMAMWYWVLSPWGSLPTVSSLLRRRNIACWEQPDRPRLVESIQTGHKEHTRDGILSPRSCDLRLGQDSTLESTEYLDHLVLH